MLDILLRDWVNEHNLFRESLSVMSGWSRRKARRNRRDFMRRGFFGAQNANINNAFSMGSLAFGANTLVSGDVVAQVGPISVPAAQPGVITTHTSNTDVVLTMTNSSHGIVNTQRCDLYWSGGYRRGMAASNVSGTSVELTGGTGTNAPLAAVAINVGLCIGREFFTTNANIQLIAAQCDFESVFDFLEADGTTEDWFEHIVPSTNGIPTLGWWYAAFGATPITGTTIAEVWMSHADPAAAHNMQVAALTSV